MTSNVYSALKAQPTALNHKHKLEYLAVYGRASMGS